MPPPNSSPPKPRRRPGAPPGNRNALKHALYSKYYSPEVSNTLLKWDIKDSIGEIHLLRATLDRLAETILLHDELTPAEKTAMGNTISKVSTTINNLVRNYLLRDANQDPVYLAWDDTVHEQEFFKDGEPPQ